EGCSWFARGNWRIARIFGRGNGPLGSREVEIGRKRNGKGQLCRIPAAEGRGQGARAPLFISGALRRLSRAHDSAGTIGPVFLSVPLDDEQPFVEPAPDRPTVVLPPPADLRRSLEGVLEVIVDETLWPQPERHLADIEFAHRNRSRIPHAPSIDLC